MWNLEESSLSLVLMTLLQLSETHLNVAAFCYLYVMGSCCENSVLSCLFQSLIKDPPYRMMNDRLYLNGY